MSSHPYLHLGYGFILEDDQQCPWYHFDDDYMGYKLPFEHWWDEVVKEAPWLEHITSGYDGGGQDGIVLKSTYETGDTHDWDVFHFPITDITDDEFNMLNDFIEKYDIKVINKYPMLIVGMEWI